MPLLHIDAPPAEVRARLRGALHSTSGLWFNTGDARRAWQSASSPLFVQWLGEDRARIGPRLGSPDVSRFCPLYRVQIVSREGGATVHFRTGVDPISGALGAFWGVMLVLSGGFVVQQVRLGEMAPGAVAWWVFLLVSLWVVVAVSLTRGAQSLHRHDAWLEEVLRTPAAEEEWV